MHILAAFSLLTHFLADFKKQVAEKGRVALLIFTGEGWRNFHWIFPFNLDVESPADAHALASAILCSWELGPGL